LIVQQGIVHAVCSLALGTPPTDPSFAFNVAATLRNLTSLSSNHPTLVRTPGAVKILTDIAKDPDPATREHISLALHNLCVVKDPVGRLAVAKQNGMDVLVQLSETGGPKMKTFCGVALQALSAASPASSPSMASRLVACMLAIKDVDESEPSRIVEPNMGAAGGKSMLPGRTQCSWDDEPEPTWSYHVSPNRPGLVM
jgi:hypothetical protein